MAFIENKITWHKIFESAEAAKNQIPLLGLRTILVNSKRICIAHTPDGLFAIQDKCPHNGASLSRGRCNEDNSITCPVHRYQFDLKTGRAKSGLGDAGRVYPIEEQKDGLYLGIKELKINLF